MIFRNQHRTQRHPHGRQIRCQPGRHHQPPNPKQVTFWIGEELSALGYICATPTKVAASTLNANETANAIVVQAANMNIRLRNQRLLNARQEEGSFCPRARKKRGGQVPQHCVWRCAAYKSASAKAIVRAAILSYVRSMNWPGPVEFTFLIFLSLFFSWIKAVLCITAAVLIRNLWISLAVAAFIGIAETALDMGVALFFSGLLDIYNDLFIALAALAGVIWWGVGRALYILWSYVRSRRA
jgi:hypothetical protein